MSKYTGLVIFDTSTLGEGGSLRIVNDVNKTFLKHYIRRDIALLRGKNDVSSEIKMYSLTPAMNNKKHPTRIKCCCQK